LYYRIIKELEIYLVDFSILLIKEQLDLIDCLL
jgi:hypothetical protein